MLDRDILTIILLFATAVGSILTVLIKSNRGTQIDEIDYRKVERVKTPRSIEMEYGNRDDE